jgi:hypothetical protein
MYVNWKLLGLFLPTAILCMSSMLAHADTIPVFNTGVDSSGSLLPLGAIDPNWTIISGPGITSPAPAYVLTNQRNLDGTYYATKDSQWIWASANGVAGTNSPYTFQLQFDLTNFNPNTVVISGSWGVDNLGSIELNGAPAIGTGALSLTNSDNFVSPNAFTITAGFHSGINTLDIQATDLGVVGGLDITALVATGTPVVPLPASAWLLLSGLGALGTCLRMKRGA